MPWRRFLAWNTLGGADPGGGGGLCGLGARGEPPRRWSARPVSRSSSPSPSWQSSSSGGDATARAGKRNSRESSAGAAPTRLRGYADRDARSLPGAATMCIVPPAASTRTRCDASPTWPSARPLRRAARAESRGRRPRLRARRRSASSTRRTASAAGVGVPNDVARAARAPPRTAAARARAGPRSGGPAPGRARRGRRPAARPSAALPSARPPRARRGAARRRRRGAVRASRRARRRRDRGPDRWPPLPLPRARAAPRGRSAARGRGGLGERPPLPLLRVERVREQLRALLGQAVDLLRPVPEQQREQRAGEADPGEEAGLRQR